MKHRFSSLLATALSLPLLLASCVGAETGASAGERSPAVLEQGEDNLAALKTELSSILGRANITIGADDPFTGSTVSVLPPPPGKLDDRNPSLPIMFDLTIEGGICHLTRRDTGETHALSAVSCRPVKRTPE